MSFDLVTRAALGGAEQRGQVTLLKLGHRTAFLNTSSDVGLMEKILEAAERYEVAPNEPAMEAMVSRTQMSPLFT